jgi:hypothetical protein
MNYFINHPANKRIKTFNDIQISNDEGSTAGDPTGGAMSDPIGAATKYWTSLQSTLDSLFGKSSGPKPVDAFWNTVNTMRSQLVEINKLRTNIKSTTDSATQQSLQAQLTNMVTAYNTSWDKVQENLNNHVYGQVSLTILTDPAPKGIALPKLNPSEYNIVKISGSGSTGGLMNTLLGGSSNTQTTGTNKTTIIIIAVAAVVVIAIVVTIIILLKRR